MGRICRVLGTGFLIGSLAFGGGCFGNVEYAQLGRYARVETRVERFMDLFPDEMSGARDVAKYPVEGARHCLVEIRGYHRGPLSEDLFPECPEEFYKQMAYRVKWSQEDIGDVLSGLLERFSFIRNAYKEGLVAGSSWEGFSEHWARNAKEDAGFLGKVREATERMEGLLERAGDLEKRYPDARFREIGDSIRDRIAYLKGIESEYTGHMDGLRDSFELALGEAVGGLVAEGRLTVKGGERQDTLDDAWKAVREGVRGEEYDRRIVRARNRALLGIIVENRDTIAVTDFGGGHDFWKDIQEHNRLHPEHMFSYIEVYARSYPDE